MELALILLNVIKLFLISMSMFTLSTRGTPVQN